MSSNKQQKLLFKKTVLAGQLIETVPIKFKKKIRQLVEQYQNQRIELLRKMSREVSENKIVPIQNSNPNSINYIVVEIQQLKNQIQIVQEKNYEIQQQKITILQQNLRLKLLLQSADVQLQTNKNQLSQIKNTLIYTQQNLDYIINQNKHKIQQLTAQLTLLHTNLTAKINQLNQLTHEYNQTTLSLQQTENQLKQVKKNLFQLSQRNKSLDNQLKKIKTSEISSKIKNNTQYQIHINSPTQSLQPIQPMRKRISSIRKNSDNPLALLFSNNNNLNASSSANPQQSPIKPPNKKFTLNQSLKKAKTHFNNAKQDSESPSETQSIEFGKQKVIEKKRIKKFFLDLMKCQKDQKKYIIDKIGIQIGLRPKQIQQFSTIMF